jgi:hypothetical protein
MAWNIAVHWFRLVELANRQALTVDGKDVYDERDRRLGSEPIAANRGGRAHGNNGIPLP